MFRLRCSSFCFKYTTMSNHDEEMWADYDRYEHTGECAEYFEDSPGFESKVNRHTVQSQPHEHITLEQWREQRRSKSKRRPKTKNTKKAAIGYLLLLLIIAEIIWLCTM